MQVALNVARRGCVPSFQTSMSTPSTSRRDFLRASVLASAVFGADASLTAEVTRKAAVNTGKARNVIFMVSDGMNHGALTLAKNYRQLFEDQNTAWNQLYRERPVVRSLVETFSLNSIVTDSAAAASAWGGGQRVNNGSLNVLPDGKEVPVLHQFFQSKGVKTGLVTTATVTHATPAGFAANVSARGKEEEIAQQYLDRRVDVLLGGGQKFFSEQLRQSYRSAGYDVALNRSEFEKLTGDSKSRLLGIFSESHIPFSIDRKNDPEIEAAVPTLADMTQKALDRLSATSPNGFFLLVEGARIDHAGHSNDAAASIHDQLAFDDAIAAALAFVDKNPDTLLVITTDHGCGGIQMNGMSKSKNQDMAPGIYSASTSSFHLIKEFKHSFEWMKQQKISGLSGPKLGEALLQHTGLKLTDDEIKEIQGLKKAPEIFKEYTGIGWTSGNHTGDLVEFCAYGPGSENFPAFLENRQVHDLVLKSMALV